MSPGLAAVAGLPASERFAALLDGDWVRHGWQVVEPAPPAVGGGDLAWDRED
jgi:hypothetical protein